MGHGDILGQEGTTLGGNGGVSGGIPPVEHGPTIPTGQGPVIQGGGGAGAGAGGQVSPPSGNGPVIQSPGAGAGHGGANPPVINAPAPHVATPTPAHTPPVEHAPVVTPQPHVPAEQPAHHEPPSPSVFGHEPPVTHTPPVHVDPPSHGPVDPHGFRAVIAKPAGTFVVPAGLCAYRDLKYAATEKVGQCGDPTR
ncbi:Isoniazid inducible protein [Mycobacterium sp. 012931]|uniref:Uncharacterized protein n=2 Tax=Mycobacterium ulcerans group TaxID=2993898 RepID=A0A9N7LJP1_9MYCO|nr:Isoniazid inducible protein [Mycobacterium sp. 012931]BDN80502.1 hypothetical protein NJB1907Z4_C07170 [Mycobacterium pseudoshottsii]